MLILGTILVTWIVKNWWKILLLIIAVIIVREYQLKKHRDEKKDDKAPSDNGNIDPGTDIPPPLAKERIDKFP